MPAEQQMQPPRRNWKRRIEDSLYETGLLRAFQSFSRRYEFVTNDKRRGRVRRARKAKFLVLGYHRVGTDGVPLYCKLPTQVFAEHMRYLAEHYRVLSVKQMADELADPDSQGQGIVVTFDDGYLGTFTEAFPILRTYKIPATVYLIAGAVESGEVSWYDRIFLCFQRGPSELKLMLEDPRTFHLSDHASRIQAGTDVVMYLRTLPDTERQKWCKEFESRIPLSAADVSGAMMTWDQVRLMHRSGISFGAHTMTHPVASRLTADALRGEVAESQSMIEQRLDTKVDEFAFPFGKPRDCAAHSKPLFGQLGIRTALTTIAGVNEPGADLLRLRRLVVDGNTSVARLALHINRLFFHSVDEDLPEAA